MIDPAHRPGRRQHRRRPRASRARPTPRRPTSAATCGRPSSPATWASSPAARRPRPDLARRWTRSAGLRPPRRLRHVLQLVRPARRLGGARIWPDDGSTDHPFLSSVDNGWLAAALRGASRARCRALRGKADRILSSDELRLLLQPGGHARRSAPRGLIARRLLGRPRRPGCSARRPRRRRLVHLQPLRHHGDRAADRHATSASRRARSRRRLLRHHAHASRTPATGSGRRCSRSGFDHDLPRACRSTRARTATAASQFVPSWGGDMFEALMPDLFVPEERWGPSSWGRNHPATVAGADRARPQRRQVRLLGLLPRLQPVRRVPRVRRGRDGHGHQRLPVRRARRTQVRRRLRRLPPGRARPPYYGDGVVTPHAAFLALPYAKGRSVDNLAQAEGELRLVRPGRLLRRGRGAQRHGRQAVPVARPGA